VKLSPQGKKFTQNAEGLRLKAYNTDGNNKWTIGYGHKILPAEFALYVTAGKALTKKECDTLFDTDMMRFQLAVDLDTKDIKRQPNQNQFDALCAFVYNIGLGAWRRSTARRYLLMGKFDLIPNEMSRWVRDDFAQVIPGLVNRRNKEIALFKAPLVS